MNAVLANLKRLTKRVTLITTEPMTEMLAAHGYTLDQVVSVEKDRFERFIYVARVD